MKDNNKDFLKKGLINEEKHLVFLSRLSPLVRVRLLISIAIIGLFLGLSSAFLLIEFIKLFTMPRHLDLTRKTSGKIAVTPLPKPFITAATPNPMSAVGKPNPSPNTLTHSDIISDIPSKHYSIESLIESGIDLYRQNNYSAAEAEFKKILTIDRNYNEAYLYMGQCREKRKDPTGALEAYRNYVMRTPKNPERLFSIAKLIEEEKEDEKAIELYKIALNQRPCVDGFYAIASCYFRKGGYERTIYYLKYGLKLQKNHYPSFLLMGQSYRKIDRPAEAMSAFKSAYKLMPKNISLLYDMGALSFEMGHYQKAKGYLEEYIAREGEMEKRNRGFDLLKTVTFRAQKRIPPFVEGQTDYIPGMEIMRIIKPGDMYKAILSLNGIDEEIAEGDTILNKYYVLDINESRVVMKFQDTYYVLRPKQ